jgi:histidinol dehydrogenase
MKAVQIVEYTQDALAVIGEDIVAVARSEDLPAHGRAITIRTGS